MLKILNSEAGRLTILAKLIIVAVAVGGGMFGLRTLTSTNYGKSVLSKSSVSSDPETVKVSVVTWGGYIGGQYFNRGFKANTNSEYFKKYGLKVEFILQDDVASGREAFKAGKVDVIWATADSFPTEAKGLSDYEPQIVMQSDWSRGGDAIVARQGIHSINDLKGKKIACAIGTPSNSFLLYALKASDMTLDQITLVEKANAVDAASDFKAGAVDAAVVWSPDDQDCIQKVQGSTILKSTKEAAHIIADVFFVKKSYLEANREKVRNLVEGWLIGNAQINSDSSARSAATQVLVEGLNIDSGLANTMLNNVRLTTLGDNKNFFGLTQGYTGMTGEKLYVNMTQEYTKVNLAPPGTPDYRRVFNKSIIEGLNLTGAEHVAEPGERFTPATTTQATAPAFSTKKLSITFPTGSSTLDDNAKAIISMGFVDIAKGFSNTRIRVEGNTDNTGSESVNRALSLRRAKAVANYLVNEQSFDTNRIVVVGNGSAKPLPGVDQDISAGRAKNRRTDFELLGN
jgi:NitT/TauT family transport system substrate-binding protein